MQQSVAISAPEDEVNSLMAKVAAQHNIQINERLEGVSIVQLRASFFRLLT